MTKQIIVSAHGADIPALGFGSMRILEDDCVEKVALAIQAGYRHVDTAVNYGNEKEVGAGIRASGVPRDEIFVTTKVPHLKIADGDLQRTAEGSLKSLGLDQVDLLLIHWPNREIPIPTAIKALCDAKRLGYARHVGVANFTRAQLDEAWAVTSEPLVTNQIEYHAFLDQHLLVPATLGHGMSITAYCPLGRGGPILADPVVGAIAAAYGKTPAQVLLRWLIQQAGVIAIPKSANPDRIRENLDVFDFVLSGEDLRQMDGLKRPGSRVVKPPHAPDWDNPDA